MRRRSNYVLAVGCCLAIATGFILAPSQSVAQEPREGAPASTDAHFSSFEKTMSAAERTKMFDLLAKDVEEFEKRGNILKRVVRLTKDTVVHIEAKKTDSSSLTYGRR
ncbi:MAG: hypothetical protein MI757_03435, partial [Pirellulales bacterium]|nr:hypothetical protein [Pirellulales bacterium]